MTPRAKPAPTHGPDVLGGRTPGDVVEVTDPAQGGWRALVRVAWHQRLATEPDGGHSCTMVTSYDAWEESWSPRIHPLRASLPVARVVETRAATMGDAEPDTIDPDPMRR